MAKILVLGAGMVGRAVASDLAVRHDITSADIDEGALDLLEKAGGVSTTRLDVADRELLGRAVAEFDLVVGAVPGFLGYRAVETAIHAGKDVVDISFCPENMLDLDETARARGVCVMVDMGVAPGMDHLILGRHDESMTVRSFECLVGGLPKNRKWPFAYKAPFSPLDVIEEYTRPARYIENGHVVTKAALSDPELVQFDRVGTLEAFNTDGLRTLLDTMAHVPDMKEKTLRYPGHIRLIQALKESGFFNEDPIRVGGISVSPKEFTSAILIDEWTLDPGEEEITVMRVTVRGEQDGASKAYVYHLYDEYDVQSGTSSMARTTGFTCAAAVQLMLDGLFEGTGVFPAELVGKREPCFDFVLSYLAERGVAYRVEEQ